MIASLAPSATKVAPGLDDLPRIIDEYATRWDVRLDEPLPLSYNYVALATRSDGTPAVFKVGCPDPEAAEIGALRHFNGHGATRLFEADDDARVFLMEHVLPGRTLFEDMTDDEEATRIAASVMRRLAPPAPTNHQLPSAMSWARAFSKLRERHGGTSGDLPKHAFERGESLYADLAASATQSVVLHGDLHHWNILRAEREPWLAIDPHGLVGEAAFEVGAFLRNPVSSPSAPGDPRYLKNRTDVREVLARRLDIFAEELQIDRQRLRDWGIAWATLSACWSDESNHRDGWQQALAVADILTTV